LRPKTNGSMVTAVSRFPRISDWKKAAQG